jgi:hypothetical protein
VRRYLGVTVGKFRRNFSITIATGVAFLAVSATAQAQIPLGQIAPPNPFAYCGNGPFDLIQTSLASGTSYTVPAPGGVITSWSTNASAGVGQLLSFKVYRPAGVGKFLVVGHGGPAPLVPSSLNTFNVSIPVQAGDIIGDNDLTASTVSNACLFETGNTGDINSQVEGDVGDGGTVTLEAITEAEARPNVSATLLPPPVIISLSPAKGSIKGGTSVVVSGANFAEVKGISFGTVAATSFTVGSESQITAVVPATKKLAKVSVALTTVAGTVTSAQTFAYLGCKVPNLKGKKLKASKKKLKKADCKVGKVKKIEGATGKTGRVVKQNPKPGKVLVPGTKIKVTLGA